LEPHGKLAILLSYGSSTPRENAKGPRMQLRTGLAGKREGMRILIADDDPLTRRLLQKTLSTRVTKWLRSRTGDQPWNVSRAKTVRAWRCPAGAPEQFATLLKTGVSEAAVFVHR